MKLKRFRNYQNTSLKSLYSHGKDLRSVNFDRSDLTDSSFINCDLTYSNFAFANLENVIFIGTWLCHVSFVYANLKNADFTNTNIKGSDFRGANLENVKGLYSKKQEQSSAQIILNILSIKGNNLEMDDWHTCSTSHCICGWESIIHNIDTQQASLHHPTLCRYYYSDNNEAYEALTRVASGEESVYNT